MLILIKIASKNLLSPGIMIFLMYHNEKKGEPYMFDIYFTYCEAWTFLGIQQPLNVFSNVIFLALAFWIWNHPSAKLHRYGLLLITLGSVMWHSTSYQWALWMDISGISVWALLFSWDAARVTHHSPLKYCGVTLGVLVLSGALGRGLEGLLPMMSGAFLPFVGIAIAVSLLAPSQKFRKLWLYSATFMGIAIIMREIDLMMCGILPTGTHFLWHIGAGLSLIAPIMTLKLYAQTLTAPVYSDG